MEKEKLIKANYLKPTVEVYPLLGECSILAGTEQLNTNVTLKSYGKETEDIDIGSGGCIIITSDDGKFDVSRDGDSN